MLGGKLNLRRKTNILRPVNLVLICFSLVIENDALVTDPQKLSVTNSQRFCFICARGLQVKLGSVLKFEAGE